MDVLKLTVVGRLAADPHVGHGTVRFSVVASYHWSDKRFRPATVAIYAKGALAEISEKYLKQGSRIFCEAHVEDGGYIADEIIMLGDRSRPES